MTVKVVGIADGDTFTALDSLNNNFRVRLHGIDCPEKGQPFGQVAKQFASDSIFGKMVKLKHTDTDRYGRMVAIVYFDSTKVLNEELLKAGLAWYYKRYDKNPAWAAMEVKVHQLKIGLWVEDVVLAPWLETNYWLYHPEKS